MLWDSSALPGLLLALLLGGLMGPPSAAEAPSAGSEVETLLAEQAADWSRGDVEAFCSAYAEDVVFISPSGLTRGRQQVLDRYRKRYPDRAAMGTLTLEVEEVRVASGETPSAVSVVARWRLSYPEKEPLSGLTLLVLHRDESGAWKIVQDASM